MTRFLILIWNAISGASFLKNVQIHLQSKNHKILENETGTISGDKKCLKKEQPNGIERHHKN